MERALEPIISLQIPGSIKDIDHHVFLIIIMVLLLVAAQDKFSKVKGDTSCHTLNLFPRASTCEERRMDKHLDQFCG